MLKRKDILIKQLINLRKHMFLDIRVKKFKLKMFEKL